MSVADPERIDQSALRQAQARVMRRLDRLRRALRAHLIVEGMFWVVGAVFAAVLVSLLLDRWLRFDPPTRWVLLALALAGIAYVVYRRLIQPLRVPLEYLDLAELLDRRAPGVGQQISNVLQLPDLLTAEDHASASMVQASVLDCAQALDRRDLDGTLNRQRRRKLLGEVGVLLGLALGFAVLAPDVTELWARRWLAGSPVRWPQQTYLSVQGVGDDGVLMVPRGELALVQIDAAPEFEEQGDGRFSVAGRGKTPLVVESTAVPKSVPPQGVSVSYRLSDGSKRRGNAEQFDETRFRYELPPLAEPATMHLTGGDDWLGPILIEPIDRPAVRSLEISALRPGASQPETIRVGEGTSQLLFLPKTQLELTLVADAPLSAADALNTGQPASGWSRQDERTYQLAWTMSESMALEFRLRGQRGELLSKPYFLAIGLLKDREPRLTIRAAGVGRRVTPVARLPLFVRANDDFGLGNLALDWELASIREGKQHVETEQLPLADLTPPDENTELLTQFEYDNELALSDTGLVAGNVLKLRGVATDASALGEQTGHSRWLQFQIVTPDELFYEILMRQREQRAQFAEALESAKAQAKGLAELDGTAALPGLARSQQVINRRVWKVANQLSASLVEMTLNDLANEQARDNLQSAIITPLETLHADLLSRLRAEIDAVGRGGQVAEDKRAEAQALADQSVEVMESILAQMALWESFIDVINQLRHIVEQQSDILKDSEEMQQERTESLFVE
ncbi:MAG: hypothetical protein DWQ37_19910 [Planctomycetota bacterium]|nr:MAG: hypothetical protein DWQ37_19910 [Planctomycetota bacterium]